MDTILVRGVEYASDDPRRSTHPSKPNGPLVPVPGTVMPLSQGGDGGVRAAGSKKYIGHACVPNERNEKGNFKVDAINELGDVLVQVDFPSEGGLVKPVVRPLTYHWEYDPSPVLVRRTPEILRALRRGEIVEVERDKREAGNPELQKPPKGKAKGGD